MEKHEIKIPAVGESITEGTIGKWLKKKGEKIAKNDPLLLLETDKASVEVISEWEGYVLPLYGEGTTLPIGSVVAHVTSVLPESDSVGAQGNKDESSNTQSVAESKNLSSENVPTLKATGKVREKDLPSLPNLPNKSAPQPVSTAAPSSSSSIPASNSSKSVELSPAVRRILFEKGLNPKDIIGTGRGGRIIKEDVLGEENKKAVPTPVAMTSTSSTLPFSENSSKVPPSDRMVTSSPMMEREKRVPMTSLRKRIAERLVQAQQTAAILTTFNEVDMSKVMGLRSKFKEEFKNKHGVSLGFMSFFTQAVIQGLKGWPSLNASIEGHEIIYKNYFNIAVAVSSDKGLIVPVIKNADQMSLAEIEIAIRDLSMKAKEGRISLEDLNGGTFTISNGGVFGSLMSTPILTPPQVAILGMHKIQDRPVVIDGKIEVRPMMYLALSYDHRLIDGREAVSFLVKVKEGIEDPERLLLKI